MEDVLIPLVVFGTVPLIVWIVSKSSQNRDAELQKTVREAISQGKELSPETIKALGIKPKPPHRDLRSGVILLAMAAAFLVLGSGIQAVEIDEDIFPIMLGVAAFPGFIGIALIVMHFLLGGNKSQS